MGGVDKRANILICIHVCIYINVDINISSYGYVCMYAYILYKYLY